MPTPPPCPVCAQENTYPDGELFVCADCGHEWPMQASAAAEEDETLRIHDANGNPLQPGDQVVLAKDLKVKGSSQVLKIGTKAKILRLVDGDHDIECKLDGGVMMLKSQFVKRA